MLQTLVRFNLYLVFLSLIKVRKCNKIPSFPERLSSLFTKTPFSFDFEEKATEITEMFHFSNQTRRVSQRPTFTNHHLFQEENQY